MRILFRWVITDRSLAWMYDHRAPRPAAAYGSSAAPTGLGLGDEHGSASPLRFLARRPYDENLRRPGGTVSGSTKRERERPLVPVLSIGPFTVATHDAFSVVALGAGLAIYYASSVGGAGWSRDRWISIAAILGGALGARLITAWEHLEVYAAFDDVPLTWAIEHSGKSLIGALAGGYLATVLAKRAFGYMRSTGDAYLLAIPVAVVIGRIGCYLSELPLGTPTACRGASRSVGRGGRGLCPVPRLRPADAPLDAVRDRIQPGRGRRHPPVPRPRARARRRPQAVPPRCRDLPLPRRDRAGQ